MADRYFQIQLQAQSTLAAYQHPCIQGVADAGLDGAILFPAGRSRNAAGLSAGIGARPAASRQRIDI